MRAATPLRGRRLSALVAATILAALLSRGGAEASARTVHPPEVAGRAGAPSGKRADSSGSGSGMGAASAAPPSAAGGASVARVAWVLHVGAIEIVTPACGVNPGRPVFEEADLRGWLDGFVGDRYDERAVRRRIERHYLALGYDPEIKVRLTSGVLSAKIVEAPGCVGSIVVGREALEGVVPPELLERIPETDRPEVPLRALRTKPGDLLNFRRRDADEYDVGLLGWDIVEGPSEEVAAGPAVWILTPRPPLGIWRKARNGGVRNGGAPGSTPGANLGAREAAVASPREGVPGGGEVGAAPTPVGPSPSGFGASQGLGSSEAPPPPSPSDLPIRPLRLRSISGSATYTSRDLLTLRLTYQRAHLFRDFDLVELSPYVSRQLAGSARYHLPYLLPASITSWNWFLDTKLYDEVTPDRVFDGVETDEQRIGGRLLLGVEPLRHQSGQTLRISTFLNRYHVSFGQFDYSVDSRAVEEQGNVAGGELNDLNIVGGTADWSLEHATRAPAFLLRFILTAEMATRTWGGDASYRRLYGELRQHYVFASGLELDASWKAGVADSDTPVFDQFSLGGATTLRGFRRDDFIGKRLYAAQNDLWVPLFFGRYRGGNRLLGALARNLKTAILFDVGTVSTEDVLDVRLARGVGLGLRYAAEKSPSVIRIDVAYGTWRGVTEWHPYVSVTRRW